MLDHAMRILKDVFGYDAFRGNQAAIIERVAGGGDALVLMPTGGGKSLCFQIPALLRRMRVSRCLSGAVKYPIRSNPRCFM